MNFDTLTVLINNEGKYNTEILSSVLHNEDLSLLYFHVSYLYLFLAGNTIVYPPSQGTNREKYLFISTSKSEMPTLAGNEQLFHPSLPS